jgi:hypothetical protein
MARANDWERVRDRSMKDPVGEGAASRQAFSRRAFLQSVAAASGSCALAAAWPGAPAEAKPRPKKVLVGGHPWVYAATLPNYDITPASEQIFADMSYAGLDAIELMHEALRPATRYTEMNFQPM